MARKPRVDLLRDRGDGRYRWHSEDVSSKAYSRRDDCLAQAGRVMGFDPDKIKWFHGEDTVPERIYDYGQVTRAAGDVIEVFIWKRWCR